MRSVSGSSGRWKPGEVDEDELVVVAVDDPAIRRRVVCGLSETIATLPPASAFTSVDLPTFGRPATATNPALHSSNVSGRSSAGVRVTSSPSAFLNVTRSKAELVDPLSAAAARRRRDRDLLEVSRPATLGDRARDRGSLGADPERVRRVLDVHAFEHPPVPCARDGADVEARVRRIRALGDSRRPARTARRSPNTWKRTRRTARRGPRRRPPRGTSGRPTRSASARRAAP